MVLAWQGALFSMRPFKRGMKVSAFSLVATSERKLGRSRRWASMAAFDPVDSEKPAELLDPQTLHNGTIPYPTALSPSAILEFQKCPQSYLFQYLYKLKQPTSLALAKGSMLHHALEQVYDLQPAERDLSTLQNLFRRVWSQNRESDVYRDLFATPEAARDLAMESVWGREGLQLLQNYVRLENPQAVTRPNPVQREIWVRAHLTIDSSQGATGYVLPGRKPQATSTPNNKDAAAFLVRGIVDRLDMVRTPESKQAVLQIVDYKTGKAPHLKYSAGMNQKIRDEALFQLQIYALLLREKQLQKQQQFEDDAAASSQTLPVRFLRLLYLTNVNDQAETLDMDLGATPLERDSRLQDVHAQISTVWNSIIDMVSRQDPHAFVGCDRSFCYCHKCRSRFVPGSVWEPPVEPT
jgi:hypothetical protein